jgi:DNA invertase Pin-like site-specific DNA recombinase
MKPAVIYARYSPGPNQTEQSIEGRIRICREFAAREGYDIIGEYIDRALTGRNDDRPDFQRMLADAKKREFRFVIVYKLDRFARNRYDSAIHKYHLKQCGIKVVSAMENIGDNPESIILEAVLEASAEYYSIDLSQKIKRGRRDSAAKGKFVGGGLPFGYRSVNGTIIIDERKGPYWKEALERYAAGVSKRDVIGKINAAGFRNRNGKPYGRTAFQILTKQNLNGTSSSRPLSMSLFLNA